jgi:hypothetical protein
LSLLCAALAWQFKQKEVRSIALQSIFEEQRRIRTAAAGPLMDDEPRGEGMVPEDKLLPDDDLLGSAQDHVAEIIAPAASPQPHNLSLLSKLSGLPPVPKIYFATRTHSQISQVHLS